MGLPAWWTGHPEDERAATIEHTERRGSHCMVGVVDN